MLTREFLVGDKVLFRYDYGWECREWTRGTICGFLKWECGWLVRDEKGDEWDISCHDVFRKAAEMKHDPMG